MTSKTTDLLKLSGETIGESLSIETIRQHVLNSRLGRELAELLELRNGFYAFESALLVRPLDFEGNPLGIVQWNRDCLWRDAFEIDFSAVLFFAEDIFGVQFCIGRNEISSFDPETGALQPVAESINDWAGWIVEDYRVRTGWPLAREWQIQYGAIEPGQRLLPKKPFVLGGEFTLGNLYKLSDVDGMLFRASLAVQLRDCPDGSTVILRSPFE